jgi:hypothetical protein
MSTSQGLHCGECGTDLPDDAAKGTPCPHCSSAEQQVRMLVGDSVMFRDVLHVKVLDEPKQGRPSVEMRVEQSWSGKRAKWVERRMRIDRANDQYLEEVVDPNTGEVVHHVFEALSDHIGHGSAKTKGQA